MRDTSQLGDSLRNLALPLAVLCAAGIGACALLVTAPETQRDRPTPPAPVVGVVPIDSTPFTRMVEAFGTVVASRKVSIVPEVEGRVLDLHPQLEPGGLLREGEVLLRIDPSQYEAQLAGAQASVAEARAAFEIERGRQVVAQREWELFGEELASPETGRDLALRMPQLRQAEARIASAESALAAARLDLARTVIRVPFDALVVSEAAEIGQRTSPQSPVAELVGTGDFWVQASLPMSQLPAVLEVERTDVPARVVLDAGLGSRVVRAGRLVRSLGLVDPGGRMAQLLIALDDPLGLEGGPAIPLGSYVQVEIEAGPLPGAVRIARHGVRENGELWVADGEDRLRVRRAEVLWRQGEWVAVRDVFEPDDRLILTPLSSPVPGMDLRPRPYQDDPGGPKDALAPAGELARDGG